MAVETVTVGTLASRASEIIANRSTVQTNMTSIIKRGLHHALREMTRNAEAFLYAESNISVVAGTTDYDLPDDFHRIVEPGVWMTTSPFRTLKPSSVQQYVEQGWQQNTTQAEPTHYLVPQSNASTGKVTIRFYPIPSTNRTIRIRYVAIPANIEAAADNTVVDPRIPPTFHDALVYGCVVNCPRLMDQQTLAIYQRKWEQALGQARAQSNRILGAALQRRRYDEPGGRFRPPTQPPTGTPIQ